MSVCLSRGTIVPRTYARAVVARRGKAGHGSAKSLHGPFWPREDQAFKTRPRQEELARPKRQGPRQEELAGPRRQGPGKRSLPGRPSRSIETPASGVCREGRSRLKVTSLTRDPDKRGLPGRLEDYITGDTPRRYMRHGGARGATSFRARQVPGPGKVKTPARHLPGRVVLCARAPAHRTTRRARGHSRDAWRVAVQPGGHVSTPQWRSHRRGKRRRNGRRFWGRRRRALNALVPHCQSRWRPLFTHCSSIVTTTT